MHSILRWHFISMAHILLCSSAVRVHDSQAYRKTDVTRKHISSDFNLVNAVVVCAILEIYQAWNPCQRQLSPGT